MGLTVLAMLVVMSAAAACCWWSLRREAHGMEIHAHSDGTVHEHFRGSSNHQHPTLADRYERLLTRWFGPPLVVMTPKTADVPSSPAAD
jgi:hypothetical protein